MRLVGHTRRGTPIDKKWITYPRLFIDDDLLVFDNLDEYLKWVPIYIDPQKN